ncbi:hypothetical protein BC834DRAFT_394349 [Gloeopeniophorella convolvens]|nr:hypothetical protein BC834DRAFT_394349 [Gloeopeniophorella convolvens]
MQAVDHYIYDLCTCGRGDAAIRDGIRRIRIEFPMVPGQSKQIGNSRLYTQRNAVKSSQPSYASSLHLQGSFHGNGGERLVSSLVATRIETPLGYQSLEIHMHIPARALVTLAATHPPWTVLVPPENWTKASVRVTMERSVWTTNVYAVSGMRVIRGGPIRFSDGRAIIKIADYHPGRTAHARLSDSRSRVVGGLSYLEKEVVFQMAFPGCHPECALFESGIVLFET